MTLLCRSCQASKLPSGVPKKLQVWNQSDILRPSKSCGPTIWSSTPLWGDRLHLQCRIFPDDVQHSKINRIATFSELPQQTCLVCNANQKISVWSGYSNRTVHTFAHSSRLTGSFNFVYRSSWVSLFFEDIWWSSLLSLSHYPVVYRYLVSWCIKVFP